MSKSSQILAKIQTYVYLKRNTHAFVCTVLRTNPQRMTWCTLDWSYMNFFKNNYKGLCSLHVISKNVRKCAKYKRERRGGRVRNYFSAIKLKFLKEFHSSIHQRILIKGLLIHMGPFTFMFLVEMNCMEAGYSQTRKESSK